MCHAQSVDSMPTSVGEPHTSEVGFFEGLNKEAKSEKASITREHLHLRRLCGLVVGEILFEQAVIQWQERACCSHHTWIHARRVLTQTSIACQTSVGKLHSRYHHHHHHHHHFLNSDWKDSKNQSINIVAMRGAIAWQGRAEEMEGFLRINTSKRKKRLCIKVWE